MEPADATATASTPQDAFQDLLQRAAMLSAASGLQVAVFMEQPQSTGAGVRTVGSMMNIMRTGCVPQFAVGIRDLTRRIEGRHTDPNGSPVGNMVLLDTVPPQSEQDL